MKCVTCKRGNTAPGKTTVTPERDETVLVFRGVPAEVCGNCGEAYLDDAVTTSLLQAAAEAADSGVEADIRQFTVAHQDFSS